MTNGGNYEDVYHQTATVNNEMVSLGESFFLSAT
jgi:hypothetical protein